MNRLCSPLALCFSCSVVFPLACGGKGQTDGTTSLSGGVESTGDSGESSAGTTESDGSSTSMDSDTESGEETGPSEDMLGEPECEELDEEECAADERCLVVDLNRVIEDFLSQDQWCVVPDHDYLGCKPR